MTMLENLSATELASLVMSALGLLAGALSTYITMNAKYYEDQRQLRTTVGELAQKILALRGEEELLNVRALRGEEKAEEFTAARGYNLRTQLTLARLMIDILIDLKRQASSAEYEVLANVLTANSDPADNKYWRLALARTSDKAARLSILVQYGYGKIKFGKPVEGNNIFQEAFDLAKGEPVHEGYVHEARAKALHAVRRMTEARDALNAAENAYCRIAEEGMRDVYLQNLKSIRATLGLA